MHIGVYFLLPLLLQAILAHADEAKDGKILEKCLLQISTRDNLADNIAKLENYANWTVEELPCLTRCMAEEKGWFDVEHNKWHKQRIVDELGADMYNYCRYDLDRQFPDGCSYAHRGFRCLKQAELHASVTYVTLLQCARQLNASNEALLQYTRLMPKEVVPCLFECFANKMKFYAVNGNWQLDNWIKAFGPSKYERVDFKLCRLDDSRRKQLDQCAWMYEEYLCWERLNEQPTNDTIIQATTTTTTTTISLRSILKEQLRA